MKKIIILIFVFILVGCSQTNTYHNKLNSFYASIDDNSVLSYESSGSMEYYFLSSRSQHTFNDFISESFLIDYSNDYFYYKFDVPSINGSKIEFLIEDDIIYDVDYDNVYMSDLLNFNEDILDRLEYNPLEAFNLSYTDMEITTNEDGEFVLNINYEDFFYDDEDVFEYIDYVDYDTINIVATISFNENQMNIDIAIDDVFVADPDNPYTINYSFTSVIKLLDTYETILLSENYNFQLPSTIQEVDTYYLLGEEYNVLVLDGKSNYVKYDLEPGDYHLQIFYPFDVSIYDSFNNLVANNQYFKITESGTYYINLSSDSDEGNRIILTQSQYELNEAIELPAGTITITFDGTKDTFMYPTVYIETPGRIEFSILSNSYPFFDEQGEMITILMDNWACGFEPGSEYGNCPFYIEESGYYVFTIETTFVYNREIVLYYQFID